MLVIRARHRSLYVILLLHSSFAKESFVELPRLMIGQACLYTESHGSRSQCVIAY